MFFLIWKNRGNHKEISNILNVFVSVNAVLKMFPFDFIFDFFGSLHAIIFGFKAMKYIYILYI